MVMRQMRENTKWIMLVTALAFVALMVFEWGMDASGQSAGGVGEIGRVNGTPVYYEEYLAVYRNLYDQIQSQQEEPITSQQVSDIEDAAFDEMVNAILVRQELERRGIRVTDDEVRQAAQFNPPPGFAQNPGFLTDGQFDFQKYQDFLATQADEALLLQLEAYYRDVIPRGKLVRQVSTGIYLPDNLLWQRWRDQNETVEIRYIPLDPGQRIPDSEIEISEADLRSYYDDHEEDFEQPLRAEVRGVVLSKTMSAADSAEARARAAEIRQSILEGEDFGEMALIESSDEVTATENGDLGVFPKGRMVAAFDSAVFAAPVGEIAEIVETSFGMHILRVDERWAQDSARAAHILIPFERSDAAEIELLTRADSLENLGESMTVADAAASLGLETQEVQLSTEFALLAGAGQVGEGAEWAFEEAAVGDVSPVFETSQAFYMIEVLSTSPAGVLPFDEARGTIEAILLQERKMQRARESGAGLVGRIRAGEPLPNVAADAGLEVRPAGPFARNDFVPGLGRFNAAIGAAFGLDVGEVSDVVESPSNAFIIELLSRTPADSTEWLGQRESQRQQVRSQIEQRRIQDWLESLRTAARIIDRRDEVLQPVDETAQQSPFGFGF
ncbi:MAG: peptidylprolyl isomerase [Gemmatimonadetes bacterium]|nr:peptidylprolyl isomerase [Gemmatimonadota bacterium]